MLAAKTKLKIFFYFYSFYFLETKESDLSIAGIATVAAGLSAIDQISGM